jgi:EmrB/QacA subfamily drug resistance transporter
MKDTKGGFTIDQWMILLTLMIASFLGRLDGTITSLATPKMMKEFGITVSQAGWISTAYIIANAVFVPVFGKLGDMIGRRGLYIFGIVGFTITSMLAGIAWNFQSMVFFRLLQGLTVSIDYPLALSIIAFNFPDKQDRAQAMGAWSAIFGVAAVFGPLLGGPLIDNFSWRSVFYINVPFGIIATALAFLYIIEPVKKFKSLRDFDVFGSVYLGIFLSTMILVLDKGQEWGWASAYSIICYFITFVGFLLFVREEKNTMHPIVNLDFFKIPTFSASIITSFISFIGMIGAMFTLPVFMQNFLGYSVTKTGLIFIPMAFGMVTAAQIGARLSRRIPGKYLTAFGMFWAAAVMLSFSQIDIKWTLVDVGIRLFFLALGLGIGLPSLTMAATGSVSIQEVGIASSVLALARNVAGAFGIAIFATVLTNTVTAQALSIQRFSILNSSDPTTAVQVYGLVYAKSYLEAFTKVFTSASIIMAFGGISAFFIKENKSDKNLNVDKALEETIETSLEI